MEGGFEGGAVADAGPEFGHFEAVDADAFRAFEETAEGDGDWGAAGFELGDIGDEFGGFVDAGFAGFDFCWGETGAVFVGDGRGPAAVDDEGVFHGHFEGAFGAEPGVVDFCAACDGDAAWSGACDVGFFSGEGEELDIFEGVAVAFLGEDEVAGDGGDWGVWGEETGGVFEGGLLGEFTAFGVGVGCDGGIDPEAEGGEGGGGGEDWEADAAEAEAGHAHGDEFVVSGETAEGEEDGGEDAPWDGVAEGPWEGVADEFEDGGWGEDPADEEVEEFFEDLAEDEDDAEDRHGEEGGEDDLAAEIAVEDAHALWVHPAPGGACQIRRGGWGVRTRAV